MINFAPFLFYFHVTATLAIIKFHLYLLPPKFLQGLFTLLAAAELLPHRHLLYDLSTALSAVRPGGRRRERRQVINALHALSVKSLPFYRRNCGDPLTPASYISPYNWTVQRL